MLLRFDSRLLKSPVQDHSSHSAEANAIRPVNQAIKFNLAHLSMPALPTGALRLRMLNEGGGGGRATGNRNVSQRLNSNCG